MARAKKSPLKDVMGQVQPMIESVAGFVVGNMAIGILSKALKVDPADTSKNIKKVLPPIAVAAGAMLGSAKVKQPMVKNILQGAAIAGAYKTAKVMMPNAAFLSGDGDGLGLTPVSAVSNTDRWLYQESTPVSGIGFPDLGDIQPPQNSSGYYLDAPAYLQGEAEEQVYGPEDDLTGMEDDLTGTEDDLTGAEDDLTGAEEDYSSQIYGGDIDIL